MLLHATACAGKKWCFDCIKNSGWNCTLGWHAEMPHALKKGPHMQCTVACRRQGRSTALVHPPFDCYMLPKRLRPLQKCRYHNFGYILHLLTSGIFLNFFFSHPCSPFTLVICIHPPDTPIFLAYNWSHFPCASANTLFFCKPQFFLYWPDSSSLTHFFSNILGFMISAAMKGSKYFQVIFHERENWWE